MWKTIEDKPNYEVDKKGQVRNKKTGRILKNATRKDGYCQVMLGRKTIPLYIHRLVATAFIPNKHNLPQVDHISGDKSDNRVENLRWVTSRENNAGWGFKERINNIYKNMRKPVIATNSINGEVLEFKSRKETSDYFKCSPAKIKYNYVYKKGSKKNWYFKLVEDIV